ncbi:MAG: hypothetical protein WBE48_18545, partial [Xanthobacteraceae bacterium]
TCQLILTPRILLIGMSFVPSFIFSGLCLFGLSLLGSVLELRFVGSLLRPVRKAKADAGQGARTIGGDVGNPIELEILRRGDADPIADFGRPGVQKIGCLRVAIVGGRQDRMVMYY